MRTATSGWKANTGIQHDWEMVDKANALVRFRGAENCAVEQCRFRDSGGNAIRLNLHARKNRIESNEIRHMGQGGIMLIGYGPGRKDVNKENQILNNHIHHSGLIYWHSHAVVMWQSGNNRVANNYIHHMPRKSCFDERPARNYFKAPCAKREPVREHALGRDRRTEKLGRGHAVPAHAQQHGGRQRGGAACCRRWATAPPST